MTHIPHFGAWFGAHWQLLLVILGAGVSITTIVANIYKVRADRLAIHAKKREERAGLLFLMPNAETRTQLLALVDHAAALDAVCCRDMILLLLRNWTIGTSEEDDDPPPEPSAPRPVRLATPRETHALPVHYSKMNLARYRKIILDLAPERVKKRARKVLDLLAEGLRGLFTRPFTLPELYCLRSAVQHA